MSTDLCPCRSMIMSLIHRSIRRASNMKRIAPAVLLLFALSPFAVGFSCIVAPLARSVSAQAQSCCDDLAACLADTNSAGVQHLGCIANTATSALTQSNRSPTDLVKASTPTISFALPPFVFPHEVNSRCRRDLRGYARDCAAVSGYGDTFARTGRLLI